MIISNRHRYFSELLQPSSACQLFEQYNSMDPFTGEFHDVFWSKFPLVPIIIIMR